MQAYSLRLVQISAIRLEEGYASCSVGMLEMLIVKKTKL